MPKLHVDERDNFLTVRRRYIVKMPVLASGLKKLTIIIRCVFEYPVLAGILLVFVRFPMISN